MCLYQPLTRKAKEIKYSDEENLLAKTNSKIGSLKSYNCKKLILNYVKILPNEILKVANCKSKI